MDIAELIGQFVQLKRVGLNYVGLCPFHSEKDPSFSVSPSKQMFHCFGCKKGGDIFAFWMDYHNVSFPQALQDLAEKYNIIIEEKPFTAAEKKRMAIKQSLFSCNDIASDYYHGILMESKRGHPARAYLQKRSLPTDIIDKYKLGFAPDEWDGLVRHLRDRSVDVDMAVQAGLIIPKKNGGFYDRFRGRIIFPIRNLRKQIVGFGARVLDDTLPKYLNTPETPIFHKGHLLYGLHEAYDAIRKSSRAVIVEGYTDVLALIKHGFPGAVATLGTALTREHIRLLKGYASEAVVVFDSDAAGRTAAMKSLPFFLDEGMSSKVLVLPDDDDPDSFVNGKGIDRFIHLMEKAIPMFEFFIESKISQGGDQIEGRVNAFKDIIPILAQLRNEAQRSIYIRKLSESMDASESSVLMELRKWQSKQTIRGGKTGRRTRILEQKERIVLDDLNDRYMLNLLIHHPQAISRLLNRDFKVLFSDTVIKDIFDSVMNIYAAEGTVTPDGVLEKLEKESHKERLREAMLSPSIFPTDKIDQVITGFENRIQKQKLAESYKRAKSRKDLESLNRILKLKRERENEIL